MNGMHANQNQRIPAILLRSPDGTLKQKKSEFKSCTKKEWAGFDYAKVLWVTLFMSWVIPQDLFWSKYGKAIGGLDAIDAWVEAGNPWPV